MSIVQARFFFLLEPSRLEEQLCLAARGRSLAVRASVALGVGGSRLLLTRALTVMRRDSLFLRKPSVVFVVVVMEAVVVMEVRAAPQQVHGKDYKSQEDANPGHWYCYVYGVYDPSALRSL